MTVALREGDGNFTVLGRLRDIVVRLMENSYTCAKAFKQINRSRIPGEVPAELTLVDLRE